MSVDPEKTEKYQTYRGRDGDLVITPTGVIIHRHPHGLLTLLRVRNDRTVAYSDLESVHVRPAESRGRRSTPGVLQLVRVEEGISGSNANSDYSITFLKTDNARFAEAKAIIESRVGERLQQVEQIRQLSEEYVKGHLTASQFETKKQELLKESVASTSPSDTAGRRAGS